MTPIARSPDGTRLLFDVGDGYGQILDESGVLWPPTRLDAIWKRGGWFDLDDYEPAIEPDQAMRRLARATPADVYVPPDDPVMRPHDVEKRTLPDETDGNGDLVEYVDSDA